MKTDLTKHEQKIVYEALLHHDGHSVMPKWDLKNRRALTLALDKLRLEIRPTERIKIKQQIRLDS